MSAEKELVEKTLEEVRESVDLFYQQKTGEALQQFDIVLGKVMTMVDTLFAYKEAHEGFALDEEKVKTALTEALGALEERDMILLADIIQYDFVEYVEELLGGME
jgi:hypothetical protein